MDWLRIAERGGPYVALVAVTALFLTLGRSDADDALRAMAAQFERTQQQNGRLIAEQQLRSRQDRAGRVKAEAALREARDRIATMEASLAAQIRKPLAKVVNVAPVKRKRRRR